MNSKGLGGLAIVGGTFVVGGFLSFAVVGQDPAYGLWRVCFGSWRKQVGMCIPTYVSLC